MYKFKWTVNGVEKSAFVDFDPNTLDKTPPFRFKDQINGHDLWQSASHTVKITGVVAQDGTRLFMTKFVDESTVWPTPQDLLPPVATPTSGTPLPATTGIWSFDPLAEPMNSFKFTYGNPARSVYVDVNPQTLGPNKIPKFRIDDPVFGHDLPESNGHQVTVEGTLTPDGRLFLTKFTDQSTQWPVIPFKFRGTFAKGDNRGIVMHPEILVGTNWVKAHVPMETTFPDFYIFPANSNAGAQLAAFPPAGGDPIGAEGFGTWASPTQELNGSAYLSRLNINFSSLRQISVAWVDGVGWVFGN